MKNSRTKSKLNKKQIKTFFLFSFLKKERKKEKMKTNRKIREKITNFKQLKNTTSLNVITKKNMKKNGHAEKKENCK